MSKYSEYLKQRKENDMNFFFGEGNYQMKTNKYLTFKRVIDDDNIIIVTNNIKTIKENRVLVVDNDKAVYLKDWQVKSAHNFYEGMEFFLVKLNRNYFKPYQFKFSFSDMSFEKEETFDDLLKVAAEQDEVNMQVALGFMG